MNSNHNNQQQQQQQNMQAGVGAGLTRYRSAPSSYFANLLNTPAGGDGGFGGAADDFEQLFNEARASSPETQRIFSRFMSSNSDDSVRESSSPCVMTDLPSRSPLNSQFYPPTKAEPEFEQRLQRQRSNDYSEPVHSSAMDGEYNRVLGSFSSSHVAHMKIERAGGGGGSGLIRHSSSPPGLFANINIDNEFGTMRTFGGGNNNNNNNAEASISSSSRFKNQMDSIDEIENKGIGEHNSSDYITGFPMNAWDDDFLNELADNDNKRFPNNANDQNNEGGNNRPTNRLSHHLSMPTSSAELSAMEKLLQDSVPCKIRAKRGHATHPRSIAERVRRTKISERMRKLQELVPNMEKQTNTSDMLDLAVDYIKDLQRQVKTLSDNRAKCSCSAKHKPS
ncbi:hypothetical protein ABFS83_04G055500 [Erythranthe nasuta]